MGVMLAVIAFITWPRPASAQCGSSASSCKNCHEVKKQDPVNTKGEWHTAHAFGDFCEFCHAGNVKAKDQAAAHTGLISPLSDVKGSCQSCHPNYYMDRANKFADTLGVQIGTSTAPTSAKTGSTPVTASEATTPCGPTGSSGGQVIDLNKIYAAGMTDVPPTNVGNIEEEMQKGTPRHLVGDASLSLRFTPETGHPATPQEKKRKQVCATVA
jgi:hypothetical protein